MRKLTIMLLLVLTACAGQGMTLEAETLSAQRSALAFVKAMNKQGGLWVSDDTGLDVLFSSDGRYARFDSDGVTLFADLKKETLLMPYAAVKDILSDGKNDEEELVIIEASAPLFANGAMLEVKAHSSMSRTNSGRQFARLLEIRNSTVALVRILASDPELFVEKASKKETGSSVLYGITTDMKSVSRHLSLEEDAYLRYVSNELSVYFDGKGAMSSGPAFSPSLYSSVAPHPLPEFWNGERITLDDLESALAASQP